MIKNLTILVCLTIFNFSVFAETATVVNKSNTQQVYELQYIEREPGIDDYELTMLVSDRYVRVDDLSENSGFILYDDKTKTIYSVAHHDKSILVINENVFKDTDAPVRSKVEYLQITDAPKVAGKDVFNYRVFVEEQGEESTCLEVQLVEDLLPDIVALLKNYQTVISGQQVMMTDNQVSDVQTACFFVDQIYNKGLYYDKGLPIQEWHSNERSKILSSYKKIEVANDKFLIPSDYKQFSINKDSKTFIK